MERIIRAAYRTRSKVLCRLGRHLWGQRSNPEVGGPQALYELCRRCGTERVQSLPPSARSAGFLGL